MFNSKKVRLNAGRMMALNLSAAYLRKTYHKDALWGMAEMADTAGTDKRTITITGKWFVGSHSPRMHFHGKFLITLEKTAYGWRAYSAQLITWNNENTSKREHCFEIEFPEGLCE